MEKKVMTDTEMCRSFQKRRTDPAFRMIEHSPGTGARGFAAILKKYCSKELERFFECYSNGFSPALHDLRNCKKRFKASGGPY